MTLRLTAIRLAASLPKESLLRRSMLAAMEDDGDEATEPEHWMDEAQGAATVLQQALRLAKQERYAQVVRLARDLHSHWGADPAFYRILINIKTSADDASYEAATQEDVLYFIRNGLNYLERHFGIRTRER